MSSQPQHPSDCNRWAPIFERWLEDSASPDPIAKKLSMMRAEIAYLRDRLGDEARAHLLEQEHADWEALFAAIAESAVSYQFGDMVSIHGYGTIKNKVSAGELRGGNGQVMLGDLALCPKKAPHLHGAQLIERTNHEREDKRRSAATRKHERGETQSAVGKARARFKAASGR